MKNFKHKTSIQVRFNDTDMMGHANNAVYSTWIEYARLQYFRDVVAEGGDWSKQEGLILAHLDIDFRLPVFFGDAIAVYTRCSRMGNKSFDLDWIIVIKKNSAEEIVAEGKAVIVCFDYHANATVTVSEERKRKIKEYEGFD